MEGKSRSVGKGMDGTIIIGASGYLTLKANARDDFHLCIFFFSSIDAKKYPCTTKFTPKEKKD